MSIINELFEVYKGPQITTPDFDDHATPCVIIAGTPRLLWYDFWINRYNLAIFIHKR